MVGENAVIRVLQRAKLPFQQDILPLGNPLIEHFGKIPHHRGQAASIAIKLCQDGLRIQQSILMVNSPEQVILAFASGLYLGGQLIRLQ